MLKAYYYLTKPGIIYGNLMTAAGGFLFASRGRVDLWLMIATLLGTALVIASACVINNYIDRDIDRKMTRTRTRALVSGLIPIRNAIMYGIALGLAGILILSLWTNLLVTGIGLCAWISYVILYGLAKRYSVHGTLVGTIPGAASLIAGYVAAANRVDIAVLLLFLIMVSWQMPHFYAIAIRRLQDYKAAGLPLWPIKKGIESTKLWIIGYIITFLAANAVLGTAGYAGFAYVLVMSTLGLGWFWLGLQGFNEGVDNVVWARKMFLFSLVSILAMSFMLSTNAWLPGEILYNLGMLVLIHVLIALLSLVYATYLFIAPLKARFSVAYGLVGMTLITGTYLVASTGTHMLQACMTGVLYLGFVSAVIVAARRKLASARSK